MFTAWLTLTTRLGRLYHRSPYRNDNPRVVRRKNLIPLKKERLQREKPRVEHRGANLSLFFCGRANLFRGGRIVGHDSLLCKVHNWEFIPRMEIRQRVFKDRISGAA